MWTGVVFLAAMLLVAGTVLFIKYRAFKTVEAQFQLVPQIPGCRVVCDAPMTPLRFGAVMLKARDLLVDTGLYTAAEVDKALASSSNVVMPVMSWPDRAGRKVGGSTEWDGMTLCSDLSSGFRELRNLVGWRVSNAPYDEVPMSATPKLAVADEAFMSWLSLNQ